MNARRHWAFLIIFLLALTAYADQSKREKLIPYGKIELAPFRNKVGDTLDDKTIADVHSMIVQKINESKLFGADINKDLNFPKKDPNDDNKVVFAGTNKDDDEKTLILFGEFITFNKGSRAKRYMLGGNGPCRDARQLLSSRQEDRKATLQFPDLRRDQLGSLRRRCGQDTEGHGEPPGGFPEGQIKAMRRSGGDVAERVRGVRPSRRPR